MLQAGRLVVDAEQAVTDEEANQVYPIEETDENRLALHGG